jgi:hypothetical protein
MARKSETRDQRRRRLEEAGLWEDFVRFREDLEAQGATKTQANRKAIQEPKFRPTEAELNASNKSGIGVFRDGTVDERGKAKPPGISIEDFPVSQRSLTRQTLRDTILWVANHLNVDEADEQCDPPTPLAVTMWRLYSQSGEGQVQFIETFVKPYIPTRTQMEKDRSGNTEREVSLDTIDRVRRTFERKRLALPSFGAEGSVSEPDVAPGAD